MDFTKVNEEFKQVFLDTRSDLNSFFLYLSATFGVRLRDRDSLISIKTNVEGILLPSEEEPVKMFPMDFEEFLWALGEDALASMIRTSFEASGNLPDSLHRKANRLWREYMLVGGMPQAVAAYVDGRDLAVVDRVKGLVLNLYRNDIEKYGGTFAKRITTHRPLARTCAQRGCDDSEVLHVRHRASCQDVPRIGGRCHALPLYMTICL